MNDVGLDTALSEPPGEPEAVPAGLEGNRNTIDLVSGLLRLCSPSLEKFKSSFSSAASFFSGWRSTPGTMPATSQHSLLSSITAINVRLGSNGVRERLRSLSGFLCFFGLRIEWAPLAGSYPAPMEPSLR
jgi:hypothetical protein